MTDKKLVLTTASSETEARNIARALVERRLAACVNIVPRITSIYRWQGKIEESDECWLVIKTNTAALEGVREALVELHSYEVPECIFVNIEGGSAAYLEWMEDSLQ